MKPLVFVVMPFGKKKNLSTNTEFNFDDFYKKVFEPLSCDIDIDMDFVREDLVDSRGIIQKTMIEKLLLAEYVVADLSFANPNVYYELGIRHCAKAQTTFLLSSDDLKFDVAPLRAIPYVIKNGTISDKEAEQLRKNLKDQIIKSKLLKEKDSPVYELLPEFKIYIDINNEDTKSFKQRAIWTDNKLKQITTLVKSNKTDAKNSVVKLKKIAEELESCNDTNIIIWKQLITALKDLKEYEQQIKLIQQIPDYFFSKSLKLKQDLAFALNRLGKHNDALCILDECLSTFGPDCETYGLLGRVYKDLYENEKEVFQKEAYLIKAIEYYENGYRYDIRNFYNGINAALLLLMKDDESSRVKMIDIVSAVKFAIGSIPDNKKDFWAYATRITCLLLLKDYKNAINKLPDLYIHSAFMWMLETTVRDYKLIAKKHKEQGENIEILENIINNVDNKIKSAALNEI